ncbi:MAG TPA: hypothetical protein VGG77_10255 [Roseiarcus sp.]|jgi:hypothetical protein
MPEVTVRWNGAFVCQCSGERAEFAVLAAEYPQGFVGGLAELTALVNENPRRLVAIALYQETRDPERPGIVLDWLLPGCKLVVDYRCDGRDFWIVNDMFEPKRRN